MSTRKKSAKRHSEPRSTPPPAIPAATQPTRAADVIAAPRPSATAGTRSFRLIGLGGLTVLAFGLLLWARLILVANPPRTAIADPPSAQHARAAAADLASQRQSSKSAAAQKRRATHSPHAAAQPTGND